jgi:hypothetical protein
LAKHLNRLYWTVQRPRNDPVTGQIMTMEMPNGPITVLEAEWPREIVVNDTRAYWTDFQAGVFSAAVVDGLIEGPPRHFAGWENATGIADDDQMLFWTQMNLDNSIRYTEKSNPGGVGIVACNQQWPETIAVDGERIYRRSAPRCLCYNGSAGRNRDTRLLQSGGAPGTQDRQNLFHLAASRHEHLMSVVYGAARSCAVVSARSWLGHQCA